MTGRFCDPSTYFVSFPPTAGRADHIVTYKLQRGLVEQNFCHPKTEIFLKTSPKWEQLDQSDCLLCSAYEVRLFVLLSLWTFRVTQALLLHEPYLSIWLGPQQKFVSHNTGGSASSSTSATGSTSLLRNGTSPPQSLRQCWGGRGARRAPRGTPEGEVNWKF